MIKELFDTKILNKNTQDVNENTQAKVQNNIATEQGANASIQDANANIIESNGVNQETASENNNTNAKKNNAKITKGKLTGLGLGISTAGYLLGKSDNKIAKSTGSILSSAGTGAIIGSMIPGIGTAVGAAVGGVVGLIKGLTNVTKKSKKSIEEIRQEAENTLNKAKSKLSETISELDSVSSKLSDIDNQMKEIRDKGDLTFASEEQLRKLENQRILLEQQQEVLKRNIELQTKSKAKAAKDVLNEKYEYKRYMTEENSKEVVSKTRTSNDTYKVGESLANDLVILYRGYNDALASGKSYEFPEAKKEALENQITETSAYLTDLMTILENFVDVDGNIIEGYEEEYNRIMNTVNELQALSDPDKFVDIISNFKSDVDLKTLYEQILKDVYADGSYDFTKLDEDFVKALAKNGISKETIEVIFKAKELEYDQIIGKIDKKYQKNYFPMHQVGELKESFVKLKKEDNTQEKYFNLIVPYDTDLSKQYTLDGFTKNAVVNISGTDKNYLPIYPIEKKKESTSKEKREYYTQKEIDDENKTKQKIENINNELKEYASDNPIEFTLITSYDTDLSKLDEKIQEYILDGFDIKNAVAKATEDLLEEAQKVADINKLEISTAIDTTKATKTVKNKFEALNKALADYKDNGFDGLDISNLDALNTEDMFGNIANSTKDIEAFLDVMNNVNSTSEEVQDAFDNLATAMVYDSELVNQITEDNMDFIKSELTKNGVLNADEVVISLLSKKYQQLGDTTERAAQAYVRLDNSVKDTESATNKFKNATAEEIATLYNNANATDTDRAALIALLNEKIHANNLILSTDGDISNLTALCKALGVASDYLIQYRNLKAEISRASDKGIAPIALNEMKKDLARIEAHAESELQSALKTSVKTSNSGVYSSSSGSSSSGSSSESEETFDWVEVGIKRCEEAVSRLDKVVSDTYDTWYDRNSALIDEMSKVTKEIEYQQNAYDRYMQEANSIGLNSDYIDKIQNGRLDIEIVTDETLKKQIQDYQTYYDKAIAVSDAIKDLNLNLSKLSEQSFNNVKSEYEGLIGLIESTASIIDSKVGNVEARGYFVNSNYYSQLADLESQKISDLNAEYSDLQSKLSEAVGTGLIKQGSEAWVSMKKEVESVEKALIESNTALVNFSKNIRDLNWEVFDFMEDRINQITQETEFLMDLLDRDKLYEDNGVLNAQGMSTLGMRGVNYNTYMQKSIDYGTELKKINEDLSKDPYNKELIARREELLKLQQESISSAEAEKDVIKSLVQEGINIHLEQLSTLIDKYKESLSRAKDLYDFQKNLADQTKNIASLEKTLMAYSGDDSEETRRIVQETQIKLQEAKDNLESTQMDRYISESEKLLDDFYNEYSELLNARLDDTDALVSDMINSINSNSDTIKSTIIDETTKVGYTISDSIKTVFDSGNNLVSMFNTTFVNTQNGILNSINEIKNFVAQMVNTTASVSTPASVSTSQSVSQPQPNYTPTTSVSQQSYSAQQNNTSVNVGGDGNTTLGERVTLSAKNRFYENSYGGGKYGYKDSDREVYITRIAQGNPYPYHISTGSKLGNGDLGWVKLDELKGYYRGGKNIDDEWVWTQEKGAEYVRTKDGAILTPQPDMVFNNKASETLYDFANNPAQFMSGFKAPTNIPKSNMSSIINNDNNISITLPNVQNYTEFKQQLQRDNKFQSFVQDITVGQMMGKGKLSKNKYM